MQVNERGDNIPKFVVLLKTSASLKHHLLAFHPKRIRFYDPHMRSKHVTDYTYSVLIDSTRAAGVIAFKNQRLVSCLTREYSVFISIRS